MDPLTPLPMLDRTLRPLKDRVLTPIARPLGARVSPGAVTAMSLCVGLLAAAFAAGKRYDAALAAWLLNRALDGLDGTVARVHARQTDLGAYLDILVDFVVYAALPIALVLGRPSGAPEFAILSVLLATFYVNAASWMYLAAVLEKRGTGAVARAEQTGVTMPEALIGGTETILLYSLFLLWPERLVPLFGAMAILTWISIGQRATWAWRHL